MNRSPLKGHPLSGPPEFTLLREKALHRVHINANRTLIFPRHGLQAFLQFNKTIELAAQLLRAGNSIPLQIIPCSLTQCKETISLILEILKPLCYAIILVGSDIVQNQKLFLKNWAVGRKSPVKKLTNSLNSGENAGLPLARRKR